MEWSQKLWGRTRRLLVLPGYQVDEIEGRRGGESSLHLHKEKHNSFLCIEGGLDILVPFGDQEMIWKRLTPRDCVTVPAGTKHRMRFVTDCRALEIYVPLGPGSGPVDPEDIVRFDEGRSGNQ
jgi:mannose-6-phosphate isomerase-like protein (cupin superfamily)